MKTFKKAIVVSQSSSKAKVQVFVKDRRWWGFFLTGIVLLISTGCATVPITQRQQLSLVSEETLVAASQQQYEEFLATHDVIRNTPESEMVQRVGERIRRAVEQFMSRRNQSEQLAGYDWEFNLAASDEANAWAMPGGKVTVYRGILPITQTEAGLAAVMAHEVAHVIARHSNERMSQQLVTQMGGQALSAVLTSQPEVAQNLLMQVFGIGTTFGVTLPHNRMQESEADHLGLIFMAMAGYDPQAAVEVWQRMARQQGRASVPEFLSTHPADETRIREIQEKLPEAMQYYQPR